MAKKNRTWSEAHNVVLEIQWEPAEECEVEVANSALAVLPRTAQGFVPGLSRIEDNLPSGSCRSGSFDPTL